MASVCECHSTAAATTMSAASAATTIATASTTSAIKSTSSATGNLNHLVVLVFKTY